MGSLIRIFAPRIAAIIGAWVGGELAKGEVTIDPETVTVIMLAIYAFLHRVISRYVNPADATRSVLVEEGKEHVTADHAVLRREPR